MSAGRATPKPTEQPEQDDRADDELHEQHRGFLPAAGIGSPAATVPGASVIVLRWTDTSNLLLESDCYSTSVGDWSFLTNHARALLCIAHDPGVRLRDLATALDITERTAYGIIVDLTDAGYVVKEKDGRRNRYQIQAHLPLRESISRERTIGEVLDVLVRPKVGWRATNR